MRELYNKPALTFSEQLDLLIERGLEAKDRDHALSLLSYISYYRLSAYWYPYRIRDNAGNLTSNITAGATFDEVIRLYEFDRHLRLLIMDAIERIEVNIRTLITYHLGHTYGAFGHTNPNNFHPRFNHGDWLAKLEYETDRSSDAFIAHYRSKYQDFPTLPIWMTTEIMSFGSLSFCYTGMKNNDKKKIASNYDLHYRRLKDWLHKLTYIRNVCAHHSRVWNRELAIRPESVRDPQWNAPLTPRKDRIFYIILMLRYLLRSTNDGDGWAARCNRLISPIAQENRFRIAMGLPENWNDHPIWK